MTDNEITEIIQSAEDILRDEVEETLDESPLSAEEMAILEQAVEDAHNEIPLNSASLLIDESTSRFSSAIWYD